MIRAILLLALVLSALACGSSAAEVVPVAVLPTATPMPTLTPTATVVPTPTFSPENLHAYGEFCDGQLKAALLGIEGPWRLSEVWDYALQQVTDCSPPYWSPAPGSDEGLELVAVFGVGLAEDLRYRNGRSVGGAVRVSFADGAPGGDGYHHWYFDPEQGHWYGGNYVPGEKEAAPLLSDVSLAELEGFVEGCWARLGKELADEFVRGRNVDRHGAGEMVALVQDSTWRCVAEVWDPLVVDAGRMESYCGVELPSALRAGPGAAGDGSFRMDFRGSGSSTRSVVYLMGVGNGAGNSWGGLIDCHR